MHYLSIVGNQVLATLNPLRALVEAGHLPQKVSLLCTSATRGYAERLMSALDKPPYFLSKIEIVMVSDSMDDDAKGPSVRHLCELLRDESDIIFNIAGGMNFQIAAAVMEFKQDQLSLIYPEHNCISMYTFSGRKPERHELPLPKPVDVLNLQGVDYSSASEPSALLKRLLGKHFDLSNGITVSDVTFDLVVNRGNRMLFVTTVETAIGDSGLKNARKIIALASNRRDFGGLFDRQIIVMTNSLEAAEHLRTESNNKVKVFTVAEAQKLIDFLKEERPQVHEKHPLLPPESTGMNGSNKVCLYVVLGTELLTTLIPIWTHHPAEVCILYTDEVPEIATLRDSIHKMRQLLPTGKIIFHPIGFTGEEIFDLPIPDNALGIEVNITPGTKMQGALLALWATSNGGSCYSLFINSGVSVPLKGGKQKKIRVPSPEVCLKLKGLGIRPGFIEGPVLKKMPEAKLTYEMLTALHNAAKNPGYDIKYFPTRVVKAGEYTLTQKANGRALISNTRGEKALLHHTGSEKSRLGFWFEKTVGYAFTVAGVASIQVNLATEWDKTTLEAQRARAEKEGREYNPTHKSELDVVVCHDSTYHHVSCKLASKGKQAEYAKQAVAQSAMLGRFTLSYVALLDHTGEPKYIKGAWFFGVDTLTEPEQLLKMLKNARRCVSTRVN